MASKILKQTCVKCSKGGGIAMCNGCQQSFCIKHFVEHRQELSQQMDLIGQEHDLLRRDSIYEKNTQSLFERINQWEHDSIGIIQENAQKARADLQQILEQNKNELKVNVDRLTEELRTCRESEDYTEIDMNKWTEQMKQLRQMLDNSSNFHVEFDNNARSIIPSIRISGPQTSLISIVHENRSIENNIRATEQVVTSFSEKFTETYGNITRSPDGLLSWCSNYHWSGACVSGMGRYSSKTRHIRLCIEEKMSDYLFFGIITAWQELSPGITEVKSTYGWWDLGYSITNGRVKDRNLTRIISSGDEVTLILDCDNRQIHLHHHRTDTLISLPIDLEQCPFPWKIVLRMDSKGDCIRILH